MDGDSCVSSAASPILMEILQGTVSQVLPVVLTIPLADDTRSDILGAFELNSTEDTLERYY